MDDQQRVSMVETKTIDNGSALTSPMSITRVQLEDHLGSFTLEVTGDAAALVLSYEEHHPFLIHDTYLVEVLAELSHAT